MDNFYGHNPTLYRAKDAFDPEEFNNRVQNYLLCWEKFKHIKNNSEALERQLHYEHTDKHCHEYRKKLIDFVENTGLRYENVWAPLNHDLEKIYKL